MQLSSRKYQAIENDLPLFKIMCKYSKNLTKIYKIMLD